MRGFSFPKEQLMDTNYFERLSKINVSQQIEHKGGYAYLSWPYAVSQLRLADPAACWEVRRFDGLPYLRTEIGFFVEVAVTVQGVTLSQIHPVLDGKNRPLVEPTAFDVNSSIQRALVKGIALHGLGLYIYAGEDLPDGEEQPKPQPKITPVNTQRVISAAQLRYLQRLIVEAKSSEEHIKDYFNLDRLEDLPMKEFDRALQALRRAA
jgi:Protein of unknown function (DUF1071)